MTNKQLSAVTPLRSFSLFPSFRSIICVIRLIIIKCCQVLPETIKLNDHENESFAECHKEVAPEDAATPPPPSW